MINPKILSKILFSVANVLSFARIAYILPASETFGQLQISYGRMLQDVGKFIFIYFTVMLAFICGLTSLYSISDNENFSSLQQTIGTLFWAAFGMGNSKAPRIITDGPEDVDPDDSVLERAKETDALVMVQVVGYILYGVYILGAVVVLINMLIAMMSNTFEEIQKSEDSEWKFARAKLWISFIEQGTTLPIPFNIVPTPKSIVKLTRWFRACLSCDGAKSQDEGDSTEKYELEYKAIMHRVVLRYIHKMKFEKKGDSLKDDILDTKEEVIYQLQSLCGRLSNRLEHLERDLYSVGISKASPDGISRRSSPGLTYSRSISSRTEGSQDRHQTLRAAGSDLSLPVFAYDNLDFVFNRRSRYRIRSAQDTRETSSRSSKKERSLPPEVGTDRQSRDSSQGIADPGLKEITKSDNSVNQTNLSDGDKRVRKSGSVQQPLPLPTVSSTMTGGSPREESLPSVSHSLSDPDHRFIARRGGSIRLRTARDDRLDSSPRPGSERRRRTTDCFRDSWRGDTFALNPGGHRLGQGVIKESSMEEQLNPGERETSFIRRRDELAYSPLLRGSGKRRETFNHPNIDAPFAFPHRSNRGSTSSNTFTEYHETRPQTRDTIQGLVLDIQKVPFTHLNATEGGERWTCGSDPTGSQGSVFSSSPPVEPPASMRKYGRQSSQTSVSTIGRLAAAATARVYSLDAKSHSEQQKVESDKNSETQNTPFALTQPKLGNSTIPSAGELIKQNNSHRSDSSAFPYPCPTTIVTISGSLSKAAQNAMNSAIYPALYSNNTKAGATCYTSTPDNLPNSPSIVSFSESDSRLLLGPGKLLKHQVGSPDNRKTNTDLNLSEKDTMSTPKSNSSCGEGRSLNKNCHDPGCLQCPTKMLEPLSLSQTEYPFSAYTPDRKIGHVNQMYIPETPISPTGHAVSDTYSKQQRNVGTNQQRTKNFGTGGTNTSLCGNDVQNNNLEAKSKTSKQLVSQSKGPSCCHTLPQVHFDETYTKSNAHISNNAPASSDNEECLTFTCHSTVPADKIRLSKPIDTSDVFLENNGTMHQDQPEHLFDSQKTANPTQNHSRLSPVSNQPALTSTLTSREDQKCSGRNQNSRTPSPRKDQSSDADEDPNVCLSAARGPHLSDCLPYQRFAGRYRKRGAPDFQHQHPSRHKRSLRKHCDRDTLVLSPSQKCLHHSAEQKTAGHGPLTADLENFRVAYDEEDFFSDPHSYQTNELIRPQQRSKEYTVDQDGEGEQQRSATFFISDPNSSPASPEVGLSTAAAMFIPAMATNLLPFPFPVQSSVTFSHKPVTKQQAKQMAADPETGPDRDRPQDEAVSTTPRKKKTSLVALVRGRRSDKTKSKNLTDSKHSRSLSLNRSAGSARSKVVTLRHQRSKEI